VTIFLSFSTRYKICFIATDGKAEVEFVFFDRVGRELVGLPLFTVLRRVHDVPGATLPQLIEATRGEISIPKEISDVILRRFQFVVSISNKCYGNEDADLSFQVHRIDAPVEKLSSASVYYRASSSGSGSAPAVSAGSLSLCLEEQLDPSGKTVSPDPKSYENLSPEV
jgi:hypothetical protein